MVKHLQNKTIVRMLLSLCVVFLIPVIILYFLYTSNIIQAVQSEVRKIMQNDLITAVQTIDSKVQNLDDTIKMFQRGNGYQSYLTNGFAYDTDGVSSQSRIESDISYSYLLNETIDDFFVLIPEADSVFSVSGLHRTDVFLDKYYLDSEYPKEKFHDLLTTTRSFCVLSHKNLSTRNGSGEHLTFIYPLSKNAAGNGGTAVICVAAKKLSAFFQPRSLDFNTSTYVFTPTGDLLFSYNDQIPHSIDIAKFLLEDSIPDTWSDYYVIHQTSPYNSWNYITLLPKENDLYLDTFQITKFFRIYILLTITIGIFAITSFLWLNYKPILTLRKKASQTLPQGDASEESEDAIGTISDALTYLHDKNQTLHIAISKNIQEIRQLRLQRLLNNYYSCVEDFNTDCEQIGLAFTQNHFFVSIFLFSETIPDPFTMISQLTQEFVSHCECQGIYLPRQNQIVLIHGTDKDTDISTEPFYSALGLLHDQWKTSATIGIGHIHSGTESISKSHMQATAALDYRFAKGINTVITYDDVFQHFADTYVYPKKEFHRFSNALQAQKDLTKKQALKELLSYLQHTQMSVMNARCISFDIIKALLSDSHLGQGSTYLLPEAFMRLNYAENKQGILDVIQNVCAQIYSEDVLSSHVSNDRLLIEILEYINKNYHRCDFSIQEIADHFEMLPANISNFFKGKMNCGLQEYLIDQRMCLAKNLLHTTDMPIKDISLSIGYYNVSSFIRRFRQHEGITPNEYRFKISDSTPS